MQKNKARMKRERKAAQYGVTVAQWYQMTKTEREALKSKYQEEELDRIALSAAPPL